SKRKKNGTDGAFLTRFRLFRSPHVFPSDLAAPGDPSRGSGKSARPSLTIPHASPEKEAVQWKTRRPPQEKRRGDRIFSRRGIDMRALRRLGCDKCRMGGPRRRN